LKLCDVYMNRDQWDKQIEVCGQLLKKTGKIDRKSRIECYARMGLALRLKGNYKEALLTFRKERKFLASNATTEKLAVAERIANVYKDMGKYENAMRIFEEVNINSKLFSNNDLYKGSLVGLGIVYTKTGKYFDAIKANSELLRYSELNNDKQAAIKAYINKAESHYYLGEYNEAQSCYINGLKIAKKVYRIHDAILCLANLGNIYYSKGQYNKATKIYHKLKVSFGYLGDKAGTASVMCSLGICKIAAGDYPLAIEYLEKHLTLSKNLKRESSIALSYCNLGVVYNLMGDFATAKKYFRSQLRIDERIGNWEGIVRAFINIAIQYKNTGKYIKSLKNLEKASKIIGKKGIKTYNALLYLNLSEVHLALGGISESIKFSQLATEEAKENENIEIEILASGVLTRARVIQLLENKRAFSNGELKKATCLLKHFRSRSQSTKNREFKGNILFESYIIGKRIVDKGINLNIKDIRSKAIKIFEDLYKNSPQYEFFSKIKILKKDTFQ